MALHGTILVFGVLFLLWKKPRRGIRLKLKGAYHAKTQELPNNNAVPFASTVAPRPAVLNVHFMYNGHSFDAYEVLGLPAGCGWERIENAYRAQISQPGNQSREFLDAALSALRAHLRAG